MASGFAAIENDGGFREPTCIRVILDDNGNQIYASDIPVEQIYEVTASRMMTDVLTTVVEEGTGKAAKLSTVSCAGKTGTTNSYKDGWFVGFTKYYTTSVWVGYDMPREVPGLRGTSYPIQIWKAFMEQAHEGLPDLPFLPYAQLSDEFVQQQEEERQEALEKRNAANHPEEEQGDGAEGEEATAEGDAVQNDGAEDGAAVEEAPNEGVEEGAPVEGASNEGAET
jgi:membrane peptidoglycan carboxypeptidase